MKLWSHHDSTEAEARKTSSSKPHLCAAHWMISSVVPVKLPVTLSTCRPESTYRYSLRKLASSVALGSRLLAVALPGRGSKEERLPRPAASASVRGANPAGRVVALPAVGSGAGVATWTVKLRAA